MRFNEFKLTESPDAVAPVAPTPGDKDVYAMQQELKAKGENLGDFGIHHDGLDGLLGPYTRRAAANQPEIAAKYKATLARPDNINAKQIDVKTIQDPDFNKKLGKVASELGVQASDLLTIIKHESKGDPTAQDPWGVSGGLIGFTDQTARALGTTKADILKMPAVEQLDYVYKFYKMNRLQPGSDVGTMYMLTFMPAFAYSPDDTVLGKQGGGTLITPSGKDTKLSMDKVWVQNPGFGKSHGKSFFTVGDVKRSVQH